MPANRRARRGRCLLALPLLAAALLGAVPAAAHAQGGGPQGAGSTTGRFLVGPLELTPTLILREAGVDDNVFNVTSQLGPKSDRFATFMPQVDAVASLGIMDLSAQGTIGFVYFDRFRNQRAVNLAGNARAEFPLTRIRPAVAGSWQDTFDRPSNEIDVRLHRRVWSNSASLSARVTSRSALILGGSVEQTQYERSATFRSSSVAGALNRRAFLGTAAYRLDVTPLTFFTLDVSAGRDVFLVNRQRQTDNLRVNAGLEFAPDAIVRGKATVGYHKMVPRYQSSFPFAGLTAAVDLSYVLLGRTRFDLRLSRDATYSVLEGEGYYVSSSGGGEILHNLFGPVDVSVRASRELMDYTATPGGLPGHQDLADVYGGGLAVRVSSRMRFGVNYELSRRESTQGAAFEYQRRRIYSTATYGF